jgi:hypothetical protein
VKESKHGARAETEVVKRRHHHADFDLPRTLSCGRLITSNGMNHFSLQDELNDGRDRNSEFLLYRTRFSAADYSLLWSGRGRHQRMGNSFIIGATGRPYLLPAISSVNTICRCLSCRSIFRFPT